MDKKEPIRRAKDPKYISGIYNYCDRWCERCAFTGRCLNYAMEGEQNAEAAKSGGGDKLWDHLHESLKTAMELLEDLAEEMGIDLEAISGEKEAGADNKVHILSQMSRRYIHSVDAWLEPRQDRLAGLLKDRKEKAHLKVVGPGTAEATVSLGEAVEVILYYQYLISAKLERAIQGKDDEADLDLEDFPKDSDGSAKIALIGIDRSISAWGALLQYFPEQKSELVKRIGFLKQIRDVTEREFPHARAFVRPGFDEYVS